MKLFIGSLAATAVVAYYVFDIANSLVGNIAVVLSRV